MTKVAAGASIGVSWAGALASRLSRPSPTLMRLKYGSRAAKAGQAQLGVAGQLLNQRVLRRADKEPGIQLASQQRGRRRGASEQLPVRRVLRRRDGVGRQNRRAGGQGAAACATQGQAQGLQVGNPVEVQTLAIEKP